MPHIAVLGSKIFGSFLNRQLIIDLNTSKLFTEMTLLGLQFSLELW